MEWAILFVVFDLLVICILISRSDRVPAKTAAQHMRKGALIIDVRTPPEFAASHLPNAVNIPVTSIDSLAPIRVKDPNQVLLLHGQIGMRSVLATKRLHELGYSNAFNLGSYERASQIAASR
jgi:phage shock protein E